MTISGAEQGAHWSSFPVRLLSQMPGGREVVAAFLSPPPPSILFWTNGYWPGGKQEGGFHLSRPVGRWACACCASEMPEHYSLIRNGFGLVRGPASEDPLLAMPRTQWLYHLWVFPPHSAPPLPFFSVLYAASIGNGTGQGLHLPFPDKCPKLGSWEIGRNSPPSKPHECV